MVLFAIKAYFFTGVDCYSLGRKPHSLHFFALFCWEMIRVICVMLAVAIEDFELRINNLYLLMGKSAVCFEPNSQKDSDGKNYILIIISCL